MGLPRKLVNLNAHVDGVSYLGRIAEFEQPKLAIATEDWRGGGMLGGVKLDMGLEPLEATLTFGGHERALIRYFGTTAVDGVTIRLVGAYRADDGTAAQSVEIYIGGRFTEIDEGKSKAGDGTEHKYTAPLSYYRRVVDGVTEVEIDMVNGLFIVDGIDRYAEIMAILLG
ncbi:phage major tail tube protein [Novosphingobium guangzhouense]|uniref:Phage major tail tube protein n=1 Tax=Novosphingobium guangzhouense TaxID=1850347 RepID=A0A2K2G5Z8_9SPHN|nr:phage major tail tube protein [Novosphingobium guangzhouense]PNU06465.1 phage major tail tube protein [Novosphingobium guangzhouense]